MDVIRCLSLLKVACSGTCDFHDHFAYAFVFQLIKWHCNVEEVVYEVMVEVDETKELFGFCDSARNWLLLYLDYYPKNTPKTS